MKKIKKKQRNNGFCSKSGIFVEGDIRLDCRKDHDPKYFYPIRLILAFAATLCTAVIAASFIKSEISPLVMFFHSAMLTFAFGLLASKHLVIKIVSGVYLGFHAISLTTSITDIKNGFYVVANEYLTNVKQTSSDIADMADKIARSNHAYYATEFMVLLITVVALICVAACVYKLDFPILFVATFPILELGIYFGIEPNTAATLVLDNDTVSSQHKPQHKQGRAKKHLRYPRETKDLLFHIPQRKGFVLCCLHPLYSGDLCGGLLLRYRVLGGDRVYKAQKV